MRRLRMVSLTRSSSRARNDAARGSLLVGLLALTIQAAAFVAARQLDQVTLVQATVAAAASTLLGFAAIVLARRGRRNIERSIGRVGGASAARVGRLLGFLALCIGLTAALALGFYELLNVFG
ncbi:MAG TPA: hypothetical protein VLU96_09515 [Gaiellaceae bacterium]|nr:hypothetical protein [Gaiellaceae bacterium]